MKSRLALYILRVLILWAFLMLAGFVVFWLASSAHAAPAKNIVAKKTVANRAVKLARPVTKPVINPIVKIGEPYRAELRRTGIH